jgi:hypothetical protein
MLGFSSPIPGHFFQLHQERLLVRIMALFEAVFMSKIETVLQLFDANSLRLYQYHKSVL